MATCWTSLILIIISSIVCSTTAFDYENQLYGYESNSLFERQDSPAPGKEPWTRDDGMSIAIIAVVTAMILQLIDPTVLTPLAHPFTRPLGYVTTTLTEPLNSFIRNNILMYNMLPKEGLSRSNDDLQFGISDDKTKVVTTLHQGSPHHRQKRQDFPPGKEPWTRAEGYSIIRIILSLMMLLDGVEPSILEAIVTPITAPIGLAFTALMNPINDGIDIIFPLPGDNARSMNEINGNSIYTYNYLANLTIRVLTVLESDKCYPRVLCEANSFIKDDKSFVGIMNMLVPKYYAEQMGIFQDSALNDADCRQYQCNFMDGLYK